MEVAEKQPSLLEQATALAPWMHIRQIRLSKSSVESNPTNDTATLQLQHSFDATSTLDREREILTVRASLTVSAATCLRVDADFILEYAVDKSALDVADKCGNAFGKMTGIYNAWPYWREYVQTTVSRFGLPPLTLPLVTATSMLAYYAEKEKADMPAVVSPEVQD